jgi:AcrR family transcriptional regulator
MAMAAATHPGGKARSRRSAAETREHILAIAADLFYWEGIRATGVDTVAARAEVAPTTLYRLFASKDDLVAAYVDRCSASYRERLTAASSPASGAPRERILAVFDAFAAEALSASCRGCPFLMVLAEFPDPHHPAHVGAVTHKAWIRDLFGGLVSDVHAQTPITDPAGVAEQLSLIADGIYGSAQSLGADGPARHGRACAEVILDTAVAGTGNR